MNDQNVSDTNTKNGPPDRNVTTDRRWVFSVLLLALLVLCVLFASGWLRFGLEGPLVYIVYIMAGLLAAVTCYGLLDSHGQIRGSRYNTSIKLSGAIVGLVVVTGGGGLYERYLHRPSSFSVQVFFFADRRTDLVPLEGQFSLHLGDEFRTVPVEAPGRALLQNISARWNEVAVGFSLVSDSYRLLDSTSTVTLLRNQPIYLQVERRPLYASPEDSDIALAVLRADVVAFGPRPDQLSLTVHLRISSDADQAVPISPLATFQLLNGSGVPMEQQDVEVYAGLSGPGAIIPSHEIVDVTIDGLLPKQWFDLFESSYMWTLTLRYDSQVSPLGREYLLGPFDFGAGSIQRLDI